jgi:hypothetical protein
MWSNLTVGIIGGLGVGAWVYNKQYRSTGGNVKNTLILAAVAGLFSMVVIITLLSIFFKS